MALLSFTAILGHTELYRYTGPYWAILRHTPLYRAILRHTPLYRAIPCYTGPYPAIPGHTLLYRAIPCFTALPVVRFILYLWFMASPCGQSWKAFPQVPFT